MHARATPYSWGQNLHNAALGIARGKNFLGSSFAYSIFQWLKDCLYVLLCCWCIKEILD
ncbi:lens epithelial cell protein LEP503 [Paramormyrops kingsleyae]|nr:lens epithelial cell protein LEP503-like [Paramormyrops kingsleyae]